MTFALTGSDTQGIINLRNLLSRIALVVDSGQPANFTIQLDLMPPSTEPGLVFLDAFDAELDVEVLKWLSFHPSLTPALQRSSGQVSTADYLRLVYPDALRQAVHTQVYVALAQYLKHSPKGPEAVPEPVPVQAAPMPPSVSPSVSVTEQAQPVAASTWVRILLWLARFLARRAGVILPLLLAVVLIQPATSQERVDPPGAGGGGGNVNLTQIGGVNVGANNGLYVRPGTGAQFDVNVLNATLAITQSGTWSVRSLDGAGNSLTSRAAGAARALDIAIVDGSGNQVTSFGGGTQYAAGTTQATPTGTVSLGKDSGDVLRALRTNTSGQAEIICVSGCTAGGSFSDNSAFSAGSTAISNTGGVFDDGLAAVTSGNGAAARITANRGLHVNIRNASGTEIGTAGAPIRTDPTGSTTQPVSGTVTVGTFPDNEPFNLAQLGGNTVSTGNGTAGTGTLRVSIASDSTGSVSATQSGTWSVRAQDGAGNALASATSAPAGTEQALIVRNIPSGTQPVSGTVTANAGTGTFTISGAVTQSGTWNVRAQDGAGNALASSTSAPAGTEQALIVRNITSGTQTVSGTVTANQGGTWTVQPGNTANTTPWLVRPSDGTNTANIKAGSTAAVAADPSLVVALSPNSPLPTGSNTIGALTANQSVNLNQVAGSGVATGNGTAAGSIRVSVASDSTGTLAVTQATASSLNAQVVGSIAHDGIDSGNPVKIGAKAIAHGTNPTAVAAADRTDLYANRAGIPFVIAGHPNIVTAEYNWTTAKTDTAVVTVSAGTKIVVTRASVTCSNANTVSVGVRLGFATSTLSATSDGSNVSGIILSHPAIAAGSGVVEGAGAGMLGVGADDADLRITADAPTTGACRAIISYYTIES